MTTARLISDSLEIELTEIDPAGFHDWQALLDLILASFATMNGVIDPPSSALKLTPQLLQEKAATEIGYIASKQGQLLGCAFFRPEPPDCLYVGKLAVSPEAQGKGIGKKLLDTAIAQARSRNLPRLRLETRIELVGNHQCFAKWGFVTTAEKAHKGFDRTTFIEMQRWV